MSSYCGHIRDHALVNNGLMYRNVYKIKLHVGKGTRNIH